MIGDDIDFFINGQFSELSMVVQKGFITSHVSSLSNTILQRNLTASAKIENNNTAITCRALTKIGPPQYYQTEFSDAAILGVQGIWYITTSQ